MRKKRTITDVARHLGVSVTTVSFIINGKSEERRISASVTKRVLEYVKRIGYTPNSRVNSRAKNRTVGILVQDIANREEAVFAAEISERLQQHNLYTWIGSVNNTKDAAVILLDALNHKDRIKGFVFVGFDPASDVLREVQAAGVPVVLCNSADESGLLSVAFDYRSAIETALVRFFKENGLLKVGLLTTVGADVKTKSFSKAYMHVLDEMGADVWVKKIQLEAEKDAIKRQIQDFVLDNDLEAVLVADTQLARMLYSLQEELSPQLKFVLSTLLFQGDAAIKQYDICIDGQVAVDQVLEKLLLLMG